MKKLLLWGDSPNVTTGFGKVAEEILKRMKGYEITVIGINYYGEFYSNDRFPYKIFMAKRGNDMLGRETFLTLLMQEKWDVVITHNDVGVIKSVSEYIMKVKAQSNFQWIAYMPIDHDTLRYEHIDFMKDPDEVLVYSEFGKRELTRIDKSIGERVKVAWLGTDTANYRPLKNRLELRKKWFDVSDMGTVIVLNDNANRWRKDHPHGVLGFKYFHDKFPNSKYYVHAPIKEQGGDLQSIAKNCGLPDGAMIFRENNALHGLSNEEMNELYNAADIVASSTMSEGWGLSCTQAFATKTPALFPRHTSLVEMIGENEERGKFVELSSERLLAWNLCSYWRPLISSQSFADGLEWIVKNEKEAKRRAEVAYNWVQEKTWDNLHKLIWEKIC
jgi:glycosyltransferase involved in cell wall biosynthesis